MTICGGCCENLRRYLEYPIAVMVTFFADEKECQETDKIKWFVTLLLANSSTDIRGGEKYEACWSFSVSAEQL